VSAWSGRRFGGIAIELHDLGQVRAGRIHSCHERFASSAAWVGSSRSRRCRARFSDPRASRGVAGDRRRWSSQEPDRARRGVGAVGAGDVQRVAHRRTASRCRVSLRPRCRPDWLRARTQSDPSDPTIDLLRFIAPCRCQLLPHIAERRERKLR
jgi:hypothetical protein